MNFSENEVVVLKRCYKEVGLKKGDKGSVIMVYDKPTVAYEVEFVDNDGKTIAQLVLHPEEIEKYKS